MIGRAYKLSQFCEISGLPSSTPTAPGLSLIHSYSSGRGIVVERDSFLELLDHPDQDPRLHAMARQASIFVPTDLDEVKTLLEENRQKTADSTDLYRVLMPSANCNFGCGYCGQAHKNVGMTDDVQAKICSEIQEAILRKPYRSLTIGWFGGEPLNALDKILTLSDRLRKIASEKLLSYAAKVVTNGYQLSAKASRLLIENCCVNKFEITLDGPQKVHDGLRPLKGGRGSFDRIIENLSGLIASKPDNVEVAIRCNVSAVNATSVPDLILFLNRLGWSDKVRIYFAPIHSWGEIKGEDAERKQILAVAELEWLLLLKQSGFKVGFIPERKYNTCLATNSGSLLFDPYGMVHDCTEIPLTPSAKLYDTSPPSARPANFATFYPKVMEGEYPCSRCRLLPVCGGACPKEWNEGGTPCPTYKFNSSQRLLYSLADSCEFDESCTLISTGGNHAENNQSP